MAQQSNEAIRRWYLAKVAAVETLNEEWLKQGLPGSERAYRAWKIRHDARVAARRMMADAQEVRDLEERDRAKYGHPDGPTFEPKVEEGRALGLDGEALFDWIVRGATQKDPAVSRWFGLEGKNDR